MKKIVFLLAFIGTYTYAQNTEDKELLKKCRKEFNKKICLADEDQDSIPFYLDQCPSESGPTDNLGCPWPDSDKDGVIDKDDICSTVPGPVENKGCPWEDTDGDGILDKDDRCPTVPGPAHSNGCPVISCTFGFDPQIHMEKFDTDIQNIEEIYNLINKKVLDHIVQKLPKKDLASRKVFFIIQYIDNNSYIDNNTPDDGTSPGYNLLITKFWNQNVLEYARKKYGKDIYLSKMLSPYNPDIYRKMIGEKSFSYMMKYYDSETNKIIITGKQRSTLELPVNIRVDFITPHKIKVSNYLSNLVYEYKNSTWKLLKE
ncbi:Thrombospondin type 3 repeat-containing protein [Chryseobacterium jejuense]|uniref:Alpha-agarase n=1 Tax=Chryseobacterium jejuense TaxID=445960 RepID=A0A2X2WUU5_CHRJE|nr:Thrombospondin type 3 repeat-containing protein [Chryseobacterium jejuense]SQB44508.1 Alpha-agarase precursor [Chryseobacterium jejuense]